MNRTGTERDAPTLRSISAVVPVFNEAASLPALMERLRAVGVDEIIVADGGSEDGSLAVAERFADRIECVQKGRGRQIAAGAALATRDILWIVHADCSPPEGARMAIMSVLARPDVGLGCFRLEFDASHPLLGLYAFAARIDSVLTTFGDQGFFMRRRDYHAVGGVPAWPLLEDVELRRRAKRLGRVVKAPLAMRTSARRFIKTGALRQQALNGYLLMRFLLGARPDRLAEEYETART